MIRAIGKVGCMILDEVHLPQICSKSASNGAHCKLVLRLHWFAKTTRFAIYIF